MIDLFSLIAPLVTASFPTTVITTDTPSVTPTESDITDLITGLPVAQTIQIHRLTANHHFCRVLCPYCGHEHLHHIDIHLLLNAETMRMGFGPLQADCLGLDYWIGLDDWRSAGHVINYELQLKEGDAIRL